MNKKLRDLFQQPFDLEAYRKVILSQLLHAQRLLTSPEMLEQYDNGDQLYGLGYLTDYKDKEIGLYYTHVHSGDVRRKRVGFRKMLHPYVNNKYGAEAAIAVFDDGEHWRLSYICDLKGGITSAKRFSYVFGDPKGQYNTPVTRLTDLAQKRLTLDELHKTFSVDALSKEFFDEYHRHHDRIIAELSRQGNTGAVFHDYVKKMMGRIVFLHFLQKKGWLNDDPEFLRNLFFMQPLNRKSDFLEQVLEPLFFGIFNTELQNREKVFLENDWDLSLLKEWNGGSTNALTHSHIDALPYLNGGLFERDEVDRMKIKLPASLFENLFAFMASYNFTVDENDPDDAEIGVDPEMLGKIFESLLEDNKAKGAFYTPKEIVRYMCKESLIAYLDSKLETDNASEKLDHKQSIRDFVEQHEFPAELEPYREVLDTALQEVKICDPAIGSGAFPMGLLNELWRCREAIEDIDCATLSSPLERGTAKPGGMLLETDKVGNKRAALKKEIIENNIYGVDIEKGAIDIARLRFWLSIVVDADKPEPLPNFDYKFMQGNSLIESYKGFDLSRISNRLPGGQSKSTQLLLGLDSDFSRKNLQRLMRDYFSVTDHKKKADMRQAINDAVKQLITDFIGGTNDELKNLNPSANKDFFLWHTWFKDIFDNGGFDIVIGNPPYISAVEMVRTECEKALYKKTYPQATGAYDIYVLFLLRGLMLSKNVFFWIIPNKFLIADYAKKTKELLEQKGLYSSIDVSVFNVFENASVYPIIVCGSKLSNEDFCKYSLDYYEDLLSNKARPIKKIETSFMVKDCGITVCSGATGFEAQKIKEYIVDGKRDNVIPFTVSGNIDRYIFNNKDVRYMKSKYSNAYIRTDCDVASSKLKMWMSPKIVIAGMTKVIESTFVDTPLAIGVGVYAITAFGKYNPYFITGLLNSKYTSYYLRNKFKDKHLAGGYLAINKSTIEQLPFINADTETQELISSKVKEILLLKNTKPYADTAPMECEIDRKVYELYNLTPEDIDIIENT